MLGEAGLALAMDGDKLPEAAGVLTPATGIGHPAGRAPTGGRAQLRRELS